MQYRSPEYAREAIIQAKLYVACEKAGLNCDLEYCVLQNHRTESRLDLVIFEGCKIIAIVEVKTFDSTNALVEDSEQIKRYKTYDVPIFILYSIYDIPYLVKRLLEVRQKFLESIDFTTVNCFESDRQNEEKWDKKIEEALGKFDKAFPDYKFNGNHSLEILVTGVKILGLSDLLKLIDECEDSVEEFFSMLNYWIDYKKGGRERFLDVRKGTVHTVLGYHNRQNQINEKLS